MRKDFDFPEPVEGQGVVQWTVGSASAPKRARTNRYTKGSRSFRVKDDSRYAYDDHNSSDCCSNACRANYAYRTNYAYRANYAYRGEFAVDQQLYYNVLSIDDGNVLEMLDYWDRLEEKANRQALENSSFSYLNYTQDLDEDGNALDPMDQEVYREWAAQEDGARGKRFPIKAELAIIHSIMERLSPKDQRVYRYMFEENMTDAEIKQAFELEHSAWANEKKRFLNRVREVFIALGYEVPTLAEVKNQARRRADAMKKIESATQEEAELYNLGKSIARELRRMESATKPRIFVSVDSDEDDMG